MLLRVDRAGEKGAYVNIQGQDLSIRIVERTVRTERALTVKEQRERKSSAAPTFGIATPIRRQAR
jgi:hypothetical protein